MNKYRVAPKSERTCDGILFASKRMVLPEGSSFLGVAPVAKPRMTQRDKWKQRPCVLAYHAFKDQLRAMDAPIFDRIELAFAIPMPPSWSKAKKERMRFEPHQQRPDLDNLVKAYLDAMTDDDSIVWEVRATKRWDAEGSIVVRDLGDIYEV